MSKFPDGFQEVLAKLTQELKDDRTFQELTLDGWCCLAFVFDETSGGFYGNSSGNVGRIPTSEEFEWLVEMCRKYYDCHSDDEIRKINDQREKQAIYEEAKRRYSWTTPEKKERLKPGYIYILKSDYGYKIGKSSQLDHRIKHFGVTLPFKVETFKTFKVKDMGKAERYLHDLFSHLLIDGEWYQLSEEDLAFLDSIDLQDHLDKEAH